ncbi:hypothetical protein SB778_31730 [Paraburkholderia sp. SIMBA_050]|uniref:hypothetical protein n=1 Tax=Paraburkholderia terricola TaxID=169427 RepID=UPI0009F4167E|nr:hypothetical protein [Paraburkholderia terricola]AXE96286.1 hypothetical protein CUJ90_29270 [Paraburkholderia terricola]ORC51275.1 hypothetical protein B2G74_00440 [Burkholderia sp. A27]
MNTWNEFVSDLTEVEPLRLAKDEAVEEWGVDIPRTLLFSRLGKAIAENFDRFSFDERIFVFNLVELGMKTKNDELKTLVATGLLESLYTRASRDPVLWGRLDGQLGNISKQYLLDWGTWRQS